MKRLKDHPSGDMIKNQYRKQKGSVAMAKYKKPIALGMTAVFALSVFLGNPLPLMADEEPDAKIVSEPVDGDYQNKLVIIQSNDVHGAVDGYSKIAKLKETYKDMGAEVIMVDSGDFSQGDPHVNESKGADAVTLMNAAGYDIATVGNHDLDYGWEQMDKNLKPAEFKVICANILEGDKTLYDPSMMYEAENGLKVGFFALDTPETQTKTNPKLTEGLTFLVGEDMAKCAQEQIDSLRGDGADVVFGITHLGVGTEAAAGKNRSEDLYAEVEGVDFILDGHSHTVMTEGENGEPIQSTGTKFEYISVVVVDEDGTIEDHYLIDTKDLPQDEAVQEKTEEIKKQVDGKYGQVIAKSEVEFEADMEVNRQVETNTGDLSTDAVMWYVENHKDELGADPEKCVALINGGAIRAGISVGDVTEMDIYTIFPFGNTINLTQISGKDLLELLEASTFCTPESIGGFPQTAGIEFTIDTTKKFDQGELYPNSTYYKPASIQRVSIQSIGGKPFDENEEYTLITNDFTASGGDTECILATLDSLETGQSFELNLMDYIEKELSGVLSEEKYGKVRGNLTILTADSVETSGEKTEEASEETKEEPSEETKEEPSEETKEETSEEVAENAPVSSGDTYTVAKGDSLWKISRHLYGTGTRWEEIYELNKDILSDPNRIDIDQVLKLPSAA